MPKHLILVGLPGAGKTTVGPLVAQELGVPFVDIDPLIEERFGAPVTEVFSTRGEAAFRRLEGVLVTDALQAGAPQVIAPGGGWAAQPGNLEAVAEDAVTVYLVTAPETASARTASSRHRPLLDEPGGDRQGRMRELHQERERFYSRCDGAVETDGRTPAEVAAAVAQLARSKARW
jgi:shikimate kinase